MDLLHPEGCCRLKKLIVAPRAHMYVLLLLVKSQQVVKMYGNTSQGSRNGKQHSYKKSVGNHNRSLMTVTEMSTPILIHH